MYILFIVHDYTYEPLYKIFILFLILLETESKIR